MKININKYLTVLLLGLSLYGASCDKEVSVSPPDPPIPQAHLFVSSNPSGASIYINGKITGKVTPDSIKWLPGGSYRVMLRRELFKDTTFFMEASEGKMTAFDVDYFADPSVYGTIECLSNPSGAAVFINYKPTGKTTPCVFNSLLPGSYSVSFQSPGCREDSVLLKVKSSTRSLASLVLKDTTVWNDYNTVSSKIPSNNLSCIKVDGNNIKWIGTIDKGLVRFDEISWQVFNSGNCAYVPNNYINCLAAEKSGVWIGTNKGLSYFNGTTGILYTMQNSQLPDNYVTAIFIDNAGNKWISTLNGLACLKTTNEWVIYNNSTAALPENTISDAGIDRDGTLWIGMLSAGIAAIDKSGKITVYNKKTAKVPGTGVTALSANQLSSDVWAGFPTTMPKGDDIGGVAAFTNGDWKTVDGMPSKNYESIDYHNGIRWICTTNGLVKCASPGVTEIIDRNNSKLPTDHIKQVSFDSKGVMWIATGNAGLVKYKGK